MSGRRKSCNTSDGPSSFLVCIPELCLRCGRMDVIAYVFRNAAPLTLKTRNVCQYLVAEQTPRVVELHPQNDR